MDPQAGQDPTSGNDGQDPSAEPQAGKASTGANSTNNTNSTNSPSQDKSQADDAKGESEKKKLRDEAARYRTQLREREDELKKLQDSLKTDEEKRSERLKQLESAEATWREKERALILETAISKALVGSDALDADIVAGLLSKADLDIDPDSGRPTSESVQSALDTLKETKPFLFKQAQAASATAGTQQKSTPTSAGAGTNMQRKNDVALTPDAINAMSIDDLNKLWDSGALTDALRAGGIKKRG